MLVSQQAGSLRDVCNLLVGFAHLSCWLVPAVLIMLLSLDCQSGSSDAGMCQLLSGICFCWGLELIDALMLAWTSCCKGCALEP